MEQNILWDAAFVETIQTILLVNNSQIKILLLVEEEVLEAFLIVASEYIKFSYH
jgi:hypothetical protein